MKFYFETENAVFAQHSLNPTWYGWVTSGSPGCACAFPAPASSDNSARLSQNPIVPNITQPKHWTVFWVSGGRQKISWQRFLGHTQTGPGSDWELRHPSVCILWRRLIFLGDRRLIGSSYLVLLLFVRDPTPDIISNLDKTANSFPCLNICEIKLLFSKSVSVKKVGIAIFYSGIPVLDVF